MSKACRPVLSSDCACAEKGVESKTKRTAIEFAYMCSYSRSPDRAAEQPIRKTVEGPGKIIHQLNSLFKI